MKLLRTAWGLHEAAPNCSKQFEPLSYIWLYTTTRPILTSGPLLGWWATLVEARSAAPPAPESAQRGSPTSTDFRAAETVSYTHLTLPTICSV
eukprot:2036288-Alexandrium_andersonii.AAC.1